MSTVAISQQRCFNHALREAALRCPRCHRFYCRECATEHEGRVLCHTCLAAEVAPVKSATRGAPWISQALLTAGALIVTWFLFFGLSQVLLLLPSSFHTAQATLWRDA